MKINNSSFKVIDISTEGRISWDSGGGRSPERQLLCSIPRKKITFWKHYWQNSRLKTIYSGRAEIVGKQPQHRQA